MACVLRVVRPVFAVTVKNTPVRTVNSRGVSIKRYVRSISTFSIWKVNEKCLKSTVSFEPVGTKSVHLRTFCTDKKLTVEDINERVLKVCNAYDKIPENQASLDSHFMNDLGLDSLDHVELIMNMEDEFNLEIADSDAEKMLRPRDIVNYLVMKLQPEGCVQ